MQFAPFALIPLIAVLFPAARRTGAGGLAAIAAAYALAKAFELADGPIHDALGVVGGHTLKHLAAAAACALVVPIAAVWLVVAVGLGRAQRRRAGPAPPRARVADVYGRLPDCLHQGALFDATDV